MKFPALSYGRSFSRHCSARLSAAKAWDIIEKEHAQSFTALASRRQRRGAFIQTLSRTW